MGSRLMKLLGCILVILWYTVMIRKNGWSVWEAKGETMFHYEYVTRKEAEPYRKEFQEIIHEVQDLLRDKFTFSYQFIGSSSRDMITYDPTTNKGFDFDVNLEVNDEDEIFTAEEIKKNIMSAINQVAWRKGFRSCEDSTRVITLKKTNLLPFPRVEYSCDFAIVHSYVDRKGQKHQQYIHFQKNQGTYQWREQQKGYDLDSRVEWLRKQGLWNDVRDLYLWKKNNNADLKKKSRSLYAETINEVYRNNAN